MSNDTQYLLVSLPNSISPANTTEDALTKLRSTITTDNGTVMPFKVPHFKVKTIVSVMQQADDLDKLRNTCESVVAQVGDKLRIILEGDEEKIAEQKTINDSMLPPCHPRSRLSNPNNQSEPADQYLRTFQWNKVKYRDDKPMVELVDSLNKVCFFRTQSITY